MEVGRRSARSDGSGAVPPERSRLWRLADGVRRPDGEEPPLPRVWDHEVFASAVWYLDARLPGAARRTKYSPFRLRSVAAAREWAAFMDYFRFPAVGLFLSAAELMVTVAADGESGLYTRQRVMERFNQQQLSE